MNNQIPEVTAIAYPVNGVKSTMDPSQDSSFFLDHSTYASDSIEASGNFFSQVRSFYEYSSFSKHLTSIFVELAGFHDTSSEGRKYSTGLHARKAEGSGQLAAANFGF